MSRPWFGWRSRGLHAVAGLAVLIAHAPAKAMGFEQLSRISERIVWATVLAAGSGEEGLPDGAVVPLGFKDPATGLVFTPYRIRIDACVFDARGACVLDEEEIWVPGGTVFEGVNGRLELRTWEIEGGAPSLPRVGGAVALFLAKLPGGPYRPLNDPNAQLAIERSATESRVRLDSGTDRESLTLQEFRDRVASIRRPLPVLP